MSFNALQNKSGQVAIRELVAIATGSKYTDRDDIVWLVCTWAELRRSD